MIRKCLLLLFSLSFVYQLYGQERQVSGKVTATEDGSALPGVNVVVKGTSTGTVTDANGFYKISVPGSDAALVFSFIGLRSEEVVVGNRNVIDISLSLDVTQLSEVVVTGVGVATDKKRIGLAVETIKSSDIIKSSPSADLSQALIGKVPGALIQSVSGQPGQQQNILLRGINSLTGTQPMIMVDGVQINTDNNNNGSATNFSSRLADLDLSNIERVEVVQGAAAATIYGAQGANGVIQIFTKKGQAGKTRIDVSHSSTFDNYLNIGDLEPARLHYFNTRADGRLAGTGDVLLEPDAQTGIWPDPIANVTADTIIDKPYVNELFDNIDAIFKNNARTSNSSVTLSGGSEKLQYLTSASFLEQESIINGKLERINLRLNLDAKLSNKLSLSSRTVLVSSTNTTGGITGANNVASPLSNAINIYPYIDLTRRDAINNFVANPTGDNSINPFFTFDNRKYSADVLRGIQNFDLNYEVNKFLTLNAKYGIDSYQYYYRQYTRNQSEMLSNGLGNLNGQLEVQQDRGRTQNFLASAFFNVDAKRDFNSRLPITWNTQIAFDWRSNYLDQIEAIGNDVPTFTDNITLSQTANAEIDQFTEEFITYGYLVNTKVEYDAKVGLSGGFRADYSSAFGEGSKAFIFPRGDAFVRLSEFEFFSPLKNVVNEFKIRTAYGEAGIQPNAFDRFPTFGTLSIDQNAGLIVQPTLNNPGLNVEVSKEFEIGTDITFGLNNGVYLPSATLNLTYWDRSSTGVIRAIDVAPSTGSGQFLTNALSFASNGWQAGLNITAIDLENFKWNSTINYSKSVNKVVDISNDKDITLGNNHVIKEGTRVGSFFGFVPLNSLSQTRSNGTRYIDAANEQNFEVGPYGYVVNKTTRQVVFADEGKQIIGDPTPDFNMSFINEFTIFKRLTVSAQIDWVYGFDIYNQTKQWMYRDNVHPDQTVPVTINGQSGAWLNFYQSLYRTNNQVSHFVEDGSFVRLRNISVSYDLKDVLKFTKTFRLTVTGNNLFTKTKYSGLDPEAAAGLNNAVTRGLDQYAFPNFKSLGFRLDIGL
ncbi:MAG: SusC/RagA family TonB-linked outer membrane protein [Chryseotalea sp.]